MELLYRMLIEMAERKFVLCCRVQYLTMYKRIPRSTPRTLDVTSNHPYSWSTIHNGLYMYAYVLRITACRDNISYTGIYMHVCPLGPFPSIALFFSCSVVGNLGYNLTVLFVFEPRHRRCQQETEFPHAHILVPRLLSTNQNE